METGKCCVSVALRPEDKNLNFAKGAVHQRHPQSHRHGKYGDRVEAAPLEFFRPPWTIFTSPGT